MAAHKLPKDRLVAIVACSYEGQPPDNAAQFVSWISNLDKAKASLSGVNYVVFGCGNKEWAQTYQRIPKLIDETLLKNGAKRAADAGFVDVNGPHDPYTVFDTWMDETLWPKVGGGDGSDALAGVLGHRGRHVAAVQAPPPGHLRCRRSLQRRAHPQHHREGQAPPAASPCPAGSSTRPATTWWSCRSTPSTPSAACSPTSSCPGMPPSPCTLAPPPTCPSATPSASGTPWPPYFELGQPATKKIANKIAQMVHDASQKKTALAWAGPDFEIEISQKRRSVMDLLEEFPSTDISLAEFLTMLPPMRVRVSYDPKQISFLVNFPLPPSLPLPLPPPLSPPNSCCQS